MLGEACGGFLRKALHCGAVESGVHFINKTWKRNDHISDLEKHYTKIGILPNTGSWLSSLQFSNDKKKINK